MSYSWRLLVLFCSLLLPGAVFSQTQISDTLPDFTVRNVGRNRIIIGWVNPFENVNQISIQQSVDSAGAYKTILSVADPNAVQNGLAYAKAPHDRMFYRLFIVLERGSYLFTTAKRAVKDSLLTVRDVPIIGSRDTSAKKLGHPTGFENLVPRDSLGKKLVPPVPQVVYEPSNRIFTNREGLVMIKLPDAETKKYNIKFFEDDGSFLFELKNVKATSLSLDRANFFHAGWFHFELYNDDKLIEKNKVYIGKVF